MDNPCTPHKLFLPPNAPIHRGFRFGATKLARIDRTNIFSRDTCEGHHDTGEIPILSRKLFTELCAWKEKNSVEGTPALPVVTGWLVSLFCSPYRGWEIAIGLGGK